MSQRRTGLSRGAWLPVALSLTYLLGCARGPVVESELPLKRVVIYRNGIGYFERAGRVDKDRVTFKMRGRTVGDFLATLAIVERGGSSVRSASFPIDVIDESEPEEPPPELRGMLKPLPPEARPKKRDPNALREVVLHLDGNDHDLSIGYVAETPVWRPSYRLVVGKQGKADLQTWGIVQNLSGEDWNDVELVLIAGAPIAFQSMLGEPVIPPRPIVTDQGEVITAVPGSVTTLPSEPAPEAESESLADAEDSDEDGAREDAKPAVRRSQSVSKKASAPPPPPAPAGMMRQEGAGLSAPRNLSALAAVAVEGATTRYSLPKPVTVPDEAATMVLLLNTSVKGSAVHLYAPDPGVPDSHAHPFRVARFRNDTAGLLERGPIAVFERGYFLGEGLLDPLPPKATATVPFALERGLAVEKSNKYDQAGARLHRIEAGVLFINRDQVHQTLYRVKNGTAETSQLLVRHPRIAGARLEAPPPGTEDNTGTSSALVPVSVRAQGAAELVVDERIDMQQQTDWLGELADVAVRGYLTSPSSEPSVVEKLKLAWEVRERLRGLTDERRRLAQEQNELEKATRETRLSLKAIEGNKQAGDLRGKLTGRLAEVGTRMDAVTKRLVELKMTVDEQEVRFRETVRELNVAPKGSKGPS